MNGRQAQRARDVESRDGRSKGRKRGDRNGDDEMALAGRANSTKVEAMN